MNRDKGMAPAAPELNALLGKGSQFEGKLIFEGTVRIDGKFRGEIHSEGKLVVGEHGDLEGEIWVESAVISGKVKGNIVTTGKLELQPGARIQGNLNTPTLSVSDGAVFDGQCQMTTMNAASKAGMDAALLESPTPGPI